MSLHIPKPSVIVTFDVELTENLQIVLRGEIIVGAARGREGLEVHYPSGFPDATMVSAVRVICAESCFANVVRSL